jgi:hypothetical protein
LKQFKEEHGHCDVPTRYNDGGLGGWLHAQRDQYRRGTLPPDRENLLSSIGMMWKLRDGQKSWDRHYAQLTSFKENYGHCNVPLSSTTHPKLARWLNKQRQKMRLGRLPEHRVTALLALGVERNAVTALWEHQWEELVKFEAAHGHCNVSNNDPENLNLARWLTRQRSLKRQGQLSTERVQRLTAMGVSWEPRRGPGRSTATGKSAKPPGPPPLFR